jgi:hypothetical protein
MLDGNTLRTLGLALLAFCLATPALVAQKRTRLYADEGRGYEVRIPWWMEAVPTKPGDEQTLAKFQGVRYSDDKPYKGDLEMTIRVVRIRKNRSAPTTGVGSRAESDPQEDGDAGEAPDGEKKDAEKKDGETKDEEEVPTSLADERLEFLNGATTLPDYVQRRLRRKVELEPYDELFRRPLEDDEDRPYTFLQDHIDVDDDRHAASVRVFVQEDDSEIFGIVASGIGINAFHVELCKVVLSLRREVRKSERDDEEDPYLDSDLLDIPGRRAVRDELVKGWTAYDSEHFILVTNVENSRLIDAVIADLEIMRGAYFARFPPAEGANMDVVSTVRLCDGYDDYLRYAGRGLYGTGGYWNFLEEELVLFNPERAVPRQLEWTKNVDPIAVLYHEAMHQYFYYSNRSAAPASWFNEGYGEVFGGAIVSRRKGEVRKIDKNDMRLQWIRRDRKNKVPPPRLSELLRKTQREFYGRDALANYAYGWAFCFFLEKQGERSERSRNELWATMPDRYIALLRKATEAERAKLPEGTPDDVITQKQDEIQKAAIEELLKDLDINELQDEWEKFVYRL